jgi:hypothetical protein
MASRFFRRRSVEAVESHLALRPPKVYIRPVGKQPEGDLTDLVRKAPWWRGGKQVNF